MTREKAIGNLEFIKKSYQKLIDENVDSGIFVGTDMQGQWRANTPLDDVYKIMIESLNMAIEVLKNFDYYKSQCKSYEGTINKLTEALKQEPSTDAVSRQELMKAFAELPHEYKNAEQRARTGGIAACQVIVTKATPVTPIRPKGKWINNHTTCDKCGWQMFDDEVGSPNMVFFNFCPNCGHDMREGEA